MPASTTAAPLLGEPLPIELMNTTWADREGVHDALATDDDVLGWLRAVAPRIPVDRDLLAGWLGQERPADLATAAAGLRDLRDALRQLAALATDDPRPAARTAGADRDRAVRAVNEAAAVAPTCLQMSWPAGAEPVSTVRLARPEGPALVAWLAAESVTFLVDGARAQLRACLAPGCVLYFAREGRREWCSTACGNRARAARHYQRAKAAPGRA